MKYQDMLFVIIWMIKNINIEHLDVDDNYQIGKITDECYEEYLKNNFTPCYKRVK